jgi:hypothetical protein
MKDRRSHRRLALGFAALGMFAACGDNLIADPSFDLWCGAALCSPWETTGHVTRVKTWHQRDFGASLDDASSLSQVSTKDPVSCIEFEVIADVSASAAVWLEMDFRDDGSVDYRQLIPESHWASLRYLVKTPTWYDQVRFTLKKEGHGRAVLAQIRATPGDDCGDGAPLPLNDRPSGARCESDDECTSGICGPTSGALLLFGTSHTCGECSDAVPCADGLVCGSVTPSEKDASYAACVSPLRDAGCDDDAGSCP